MNKGKNSEDRDEGSEAASKKALGAKNIFAKTNRGLLLDIVVFVANLFLMRMLTQLFIDLFQRANADDRLAKLTLGLAALSMWVLPVAGAVLKRWHFHRRRGLKTNTKYSALSGCLFNPIFYFCLNLVIMTTILASLGEQILGEARLNTGAVFLPLLLSGLVLIIVQTYLIFRYFAVPKHAPKSEFMRARSAKLSATCASSST